MGTKPVTGHTSSAVEAFLRSESPPFPAVETMEVPIFPRSSWPGFTDGSSTSSAKTPRSMSDLHCLAPAVEIEEEDMSMEHMKVVDGWSMYRFHWLLNRLTHWCLAAYPPISSPSPTPSLGLGGTSSQVDELLPPSPPAGPGASVSILELESLKMGKSSFWHSLGLTRILVRGSSDTEAE